MYKLLEYVASSSIVLKNGQNVITSARYTHALVVLLLPHENGVVPIPKVAQRPAQRPSRTATSATIALCKFAASAFLFILLAQMAWHQAKLALPSRAKGIYIITPEILKALPAIKQLQIGVLHIFCQHTSCGLTINENWDPDSRADLRDALDRIVPQDHSNSGKLYRHSAEGKDDEPAHIQSSLVGVSLTIPITKGKLQLGTWQDVMLCEFRESPHQRNLVLTAQGE